MKIERDLYRIITDRLQFARGDLFLYIEEPDPELKMFSYTIYDSVYDDSMRAGIPTIAEMEELLLEKDLWTPLDDRMAEEKKEEVENLKIEAFDSYFKPKQLRNIKFRIKSVERDIAKLLSKRMQYRRETCEGLAEDERRTWLILNSVKDKDGKKYKLGPSEEPEIIEFYLENMIDPQKIRFISKSEPWRSMWVSAEKSGDLFGKPSTQFSDYQLSLCSNSIMYDNVYQSPECPPHEVIDDDDCLDGWLIKQRKERESTTRENANKKAMTNPKIANAQEVFVKVDSPEDAQRVFDMNSERGKQIIGQRAQKIEEKGRVKQGDFEDVAMSEQIKANQMMLQKLRGR